jgi:hypothetical protein
LEGLNSRRFYRRKRNFHNSPAICLVLQVKATIAPDSSRTVDRVQQGALEGVQQINHFRALENDTKQEIINKAFDIKHTNYR